jgi:hypothetical protein
VGAGVRGKEANLPHFPHFLPIQTTSDLSFRVGIDLGLVSRFDRFGFGHFPDIDADQTAYLARLPDLWIVRNLIPPVVGEVVERYPVYFGNVPSTLY